MAYDDVGTRREVASLLSRYPKPDRAKQAALAEMRDEAMLDKMGKRYNKIMPSPEPGEAKAKGGKVKGYAKGGSVTRGDGCCTKGHTKGRMV